MGKTFKDRKDRDKFSTKKNSYNKRKKEDKLKRNKESCLI